VLRGARRNHSQPDRRVLCGQLKQVGMAKDMDPEELRLLRRLFDEYDVDRSGQIDAGEVRGAMLRLRLPAGPADVAALLTTVDENGDGQISFDEFARHLLRRRATVRAVFDALDADGDGRLRATELATALQRIASPATAGKTTETAAAAVDADTVRQLLLLLDKNDDGDVDFDEFLAATVLLPRIAIDTFFRQWYGGTLIDAGDGGLIPAAMPVPTTTTTTATATTKAASAASAILLSLVSGAIAGAVSRTATAPLDRIKTLLQVAGTGGAAAGGTASPGLVGTVRAVYAQAGVRGFFRGNGVNVLKVMPELGLRFACFEGLRTAVCADPAAPTATERFVAGGMAGIVSQAAVYPLDVLKTRLAASGPGDYRGLVDCFRKTLAGPPGGVGALYRGMAPMLVGSFPYAAIDLAVLSLLKDAWIQRATDRAATTDGRVPRPNTLWLLTFAATSSGIASVFTYPLNLVRTRLQAPSRAPGAVRYTGAIDCFRKTWAAEGVRGFYRGLGTSLLKSLPSASTSYLVYETSRRMLEGPLLGR
jgi:solute carrier family 25 (mitochondrial phosphate transporter), member 23/24/25/41